LVKIRVNKADITVSLDLLLLQQLLLELPNFIFLRFAFKILDRGSPLVIPILGFVNSTSSLPEDLEMRARVLFLGVDRVL